MRNEFNANRALTDTAKLRTIGVLQFEIARERRKPGTLGARRPMFAECNQCGRRQNGNCQCAA